jgi:hypothetical protein
MSNPQTQKFAAVLVSSDADVIVTLNPFCEDCFCLKMQCEIRNSWTIGPKDVRDFHALGVSRVKVKCICQKSLLKLLEPNKPIAEKKKEKKSKSKTSKKKEKSKLEIDPKIVEEIASDTKKYLVVDVLETDITIRQHVISKTEPKK